jgi:hypothetical protein
VLKAIRDLALFDVLTLPGFDGNMNRFTGTMYLERLYLFIFLRGTGTAPIPTRLKRLDQFFLAFIQISDIDIDSVIPVRNYVFHGLTS